MQHKIVTSKGNSTKLDITIASSDAELAVKLREAKADKNQRIWWFGSDEQPEQKKEQKGN